MKVHRHHVDGHLGTGLAYIAPRLVTPLQEPVHRELHLLLDDLGCEWPRDGEPLLLHRARRWAVTCGWAADAGRSLTFDPAACRALQAFFLDVVDAVGGSS